MKLEEIIEKLENMKKDFIPTTSEESAGNYDIKKLFESLTDYTNHTKKHSQNSCTGSKTYDTWTTISNNCPSNENPGIIDNNNCKKLETYYDDLESGGSCYSGSPDPVSCEVDLICSTNFYDNSHLGCSQVENKINKYLTTLLQYYINNKEIIINKVLGDDNDGPINDGETTFNLYMINKDYIDKFYTPIKTVIKNIDEKITTKVYETFNEFLNNPSKDTYQLRNSKDFNLFSWMNCSAIGQDYNATLSILKSSLTKELKIITYVSLLFEFLLIANLYIMVGLSKNLINKKFEMNEEKNVSIEEIDINELEKAEKEEEIYSIKNKNKIDSSQKLGKIKKNYSNPTLVSLSGSDRRNISQNGEKVNEIMNMKRKNKKDNKDKNN
jgi:hypothetical protein